MSGKRAFFQEGIPSLPYRKEKASLLTSRYPIKNGFSQQAVSFSSGTLNIPLRFFSPNFVGAACPGAGRGRRLVIQKNRTGIISCFVLSKAKYLEQPKQ